MPSSEGSMRDRILHVALELFTEQGYDGTSLREIAERLNVTKAALYYHFKSKEALLLSLMEELKESIDALVAWAREQPFSPEFQAELLERLADLFYGDASRIVRLLQENQPVIRSLASEKHGIGGAKPGEWVFEILDLLTPLDADLYRRTRIRTALMAIVFGSFASRRLDGGGLQVSPDEQKKVSLVVARELLDSQFGQ
jgi:AcrR family transcriptional regulator